MDEQTARHIYPANLQSSGFAHRRHLLANDHRLNPNGGTNTALIDQVKLNTTQVANGSFETPNVGANTTTFNPANASPWVFSGASAGITHNGSNLINGMTAPAGVQTGAVRNTGSVSQTVSVTPGGNYTVSFYAAQAANNNTWQNIQTTLQSLTPAVVSTKQFVWDGNTVVEERDATGTNVLRRFYPQGEQIGGVKYFYTRDHLGSVRELVDSTGVIQARYDYDPFGVRTKLSGSLDAEFGYTGHYYHQTSGLNLSLYRAYDADTGRWLSRDPIEERGGINLYGYVGNDSLGRIDPFGLRDVYLAIWGARVPYGAFGYGSVGHAGIFELDGRTIVSQFPTPHATTGINTSLSYPDTLETEGRLPDQVYKVFVPDDAAFDTAVDDILRTPEWYWNPDGKTTTNCTRSARDAFRAGGVPIPLDNWPGDWPLNLKPMMGWSGQPWKIITVPTNSIPYRL